MTFVEEEEGRLYSGHHSSAVLQWVREIGLNSNNNKGKWGLISDKPSGSFWWMEND